MFDIIYPVAVVLTGYIVLGVTGFGSALVIVPLLALIWPLPEVVALTLMMDLPASLLHGGLNLRQVSFGELRRLLPGMIAGTLIGLWLTSVLSARWPLLLLGGYVILVGAQTFRPSAAPRGPPVNHWAPLAGTAIGIVEMLFGTAGPLVVAWLSRRLGSIEALRASTPVVIAMGALAVLIAMGFSGRLSHAALWMRWAGLIGVCALGVVIGNLLASRIAAQTLRRAVCLLLIVSGLALILNALTG